MTIATSSNVIEKKRSEKNYPYAEYTQSTRTINCDKL